MLDERRECSTQPVTSLRGEIGLSAPDRERSPGSEDGDFWEKERKQIAYWEQDEVFCLDQRVSVRNNYLHTLACTAPASFYILTIKEQLQARRPGEWQAAGSQGTFQQEPSSEYPNPLDQGLPSSRKKCSQQVTFLLMTSEAMKREYLTTTCWIWKMLFGEVQCTEDSNCQCSPLGLGRGPSCCTLLRENVEAQPRKETQGLSASSNPFISRVHIQSIRH